MKKTTYEIRAKHKGGRNSSFFANRNTLAEAKECCKTYKSWSKEGFKIIEITTTRKEIKE